jgi:hypothetical protein
MFITGCVDRSEHPQTIKPSTNGAKIVHGIDSTFTVIKDLTGAPASARLHFRVWGDDWLGTISHSIVIVEGSDTIFTDGWKTEIACEAADLLKKATTNADSSRAADKRKKDELYYFTHQESLFEKPRIVKSWSYTKQLLLDDLRKSNRSTTDAKEILNEIRTIISQPRYSGFQYSRDPFGDDAPRYIWVTRIKKFLFYYNN